MRVAAWLLGAFLAAGFASCLPRTATWPLPSGLGGVMGDALLRAPAWVFGPLAGWNRWTIAIVLGLAALFYLGGCRRIWLARERR